MQGKELLKQYTSLLVEIKDIRRDIASLERQGPKRERDIVFGSNAEFPFQERGFTIEGYNIMDDTLERRKSTLKKRIDKCESMKVEIEEFINTIPDSLTRRVFQYRYIEGLEWLPIAMRIGRVHESYPRKYIHDKYLENLK